MRRDAPNGNGFLLDATARAVDARRANLRLVQELTHEPWRRLDDKRAEIAKDVYLAVSLAAGLGRTGQ
jgi:hypothetical protein